MAKIYTISLSLSRWAEGVIDGVIDTTVKSGDPRLAPNWRIVMGHKRGTVSDEEYIREYLNMMRRSYIENRDFWNELLKREKLVLACYCKKQARFCHRYILAEIFERLGGEIVGEIVDRKGTVVPIPRLARPYMRT